MAGPDPSDAQRLNALRALIYRPGPWNQQRPFLYDHDDFKELRVKLLSHYLATRRGNCVSMPILFLILADRLGLDMSLAMAPAHFFLRHRAQDGTITNLEATSGAEPARDIWIRQSRNVTDRAVATGFHMRSLSRREGISALALTVVEHLIARGHFREAMAVTELIIRCNPRDGFAWANRAQACFLILGSEFLHPLGSHLTIPVARRAEYLMLLERNHRAFAVAEHLGFEGTPITRTKGQAHVEPCHRCRADAARPRSHLETPFDKENARAAVAGRPAQPHCLRRRRSCQQD